MNKMLKVHCAVLDSEIAACGERRCRMARGVNDYVTCLRCKNTKYFKTHYKKPPTEKQLAAWRRWKNKQYGYTGKSVTMSVKRSLHVKHARRSK